MKKLNACSRLVGLMLLIASCKNSVPRLQLTGTTSLPHFPSASALQYHNGRLFVFGDDAPYMLILDARFNAVDSVRFIADTARRMAKENKPDVESVAVLQNDQAPSLLAFGSMSAAARNRSFVFPFFNPHQYKVLSLDALQTALQPVGALNIEGATFVFGKLVLANRANLAKPVNQLLVLDTRGATPKLERIITLHLPQAKNIIGLSDLYYDEKKDRLLFVASQEATANAYDDGEIEGSFLGWIDRFSTKASLQRISASGLIDLASISPLFKQQKIEGLCITDRSGIETKLVLAADNDDGKSILFTVKLKD